MTGPEDNCLLAACRLHPPSSPAARWALSKNKCHTSFWALMAGTRGGTQKAHAPRNLQPAGRSRPCPAPAPQQLQPQPCSCSKGHWPPLPPPAAGTRAGPQQHAQGETSFPILFVKKQNTQPIHCSCQETQWLVNPYRFFHFSDFDNSIEVTLYGTPEPTSISFQFTVKI